MISVMLFVRLLAQFPALPHSLTHSLVNFRKPSGGEFTYQGTSCWHKTYFVLSKMDQVYRSAINGAKTEAQKSEAASRAVNGQYLELGVLLGSSLKRLRTNPKFTTHSELTPPLRCPQLLPYLTIVWPLVCLSSNPPPPIPTQQIWNCYWFAYSLGLLLSWLMSYFRTRSQCARLKHPTCKESSQPFNKCAENWRLTSKVLGPLTSNTSLVVRICLLFESF